MLIGVGKKMLCRMTRRPLIYIGLCSMGVTANTDEFNILTGVYVGSDRDNHHRYVGMEQ